MTPSLDDRLALHELIARYGHIIDGGDYSILDQIFTDDAVFELIGLPGGRCDGLPAIIDMMEASTSHPLAHHASNIVIESDDNTIRVLSKGLGVGRGGRVGSVVYRDVVIKGGRGWRIIERVCELRGAS